MSRLTYGNGGDAGHAAAFLVDLPFKEWKMKVIRVKRYMSMSAMRTCRGNSRGLYKLLELFVMK